jgi:hypothetical protein
MNMISHPNHIHESSGASGRFELVELEDSSTLAEMLGERLSREKIPVQEMFR